MQPQTISTCNESPERGLWSSILCYGALVLFMMLWVVITMMSICNPHTAYYVIMPMRLDLEVLGDRSSAPSPTPMIRGSGDPWGASCRWACQSV